MQKLKKKKPDCMRLYHGTSSCEPKLIYEDGLNINYAVDGRMWGKALYFAQNFNYLHSFSYKVPDQ